MKTLVSIALLTLALAIVSSCGESTGSTAASLIPSLTIQCGDSACLE